jgi:hypothetical protein
MIVGSLTILVTIPRGRTGACAGEGSESESEPTRRLLSPCQATFPLLYLRRRETGEMWK